MTDTTTLAPTDAEILDAAEDFRSQYMHGGTTFDEFDEIGFTRAVLAKWGAPAPASGESVALRYRMHGDLQWQYTENPDQASHADEIQRLATTAQEVRTPLDERDILHRVAGHSHPGTAGYDIELARFVESAHGITAAQKETP